MTLTTVRAKLTALGVGSMVVALSIGVAGYFGITGVASGIGATAIAHSALRHHLEADMMHDALRGDVLAALLARTAEERQQVKSDLAEHATLFRDSLAANEALELPPSVRQAMIATEPTLNAYIASAEQTVAKAFENPTAAREAALPAFLETFGVLEGKMSEISDGIHAVSKDADTASSEHVAASARHMLITGTVALIALGWVIGYVNRTMGRQLGDVGHALERTTARVAEVSRNVSESAQNLASGSTSQAESLERTSASMEQMAAMTRKNAENSQHAAMLMADVDRQVGDSNQSLSMMVSSMTAIEESSAKVARIIKTIDEIAFQTNILALNAAVEAARAGEAGMGFAVVADEVRNLAQRSAQAAQDTTRLIEESTQNAASGATKVQEVAVSVSTIIESVAKVKSLVEEVSAASREQAQGIEQVTQAVAQMESVTQTTAASAEESAAASQELNAEAETARSIVRQLEVFIGSGSAAPTARSKPAAKPAHAPAAHATAAKNVVKMPKKAAAPKPVAVAKPTKAEEAIPFGDTGTYGSF